MKLGIFVENLKIAFTSIRSYKLRTTLTVLIIAFGIMSLIAILTSIEAIKYSLYSSFSQMGANTFTISEHSIYVEEGGEMQKSKPLTFKNVTEFKEKYSFLSQVSIHTMFSSIATLKYETLNTNPNISIYGIDENYLSASGYSLYSGRNFTKHEVESGMYLIIIGSSIADKLFSNKEKILGKTIRMGNVPYQVVGVIEKKGSAMGFSTDNSAYIPLLNARNSSQRNLNYSISVQVDETENLEDAINEATQLLRLIRKIKYGDKNDFNISKSNSLAQMLIDNIQYITLAATLLGFITLFGAAIGLMNIMMVAVTERTKEIGLRKAIGATPLKVKMQFLVESVIIGQIGGLFGIVLGIVAGNAISFFIKTPFIIPWGWIIFGIILCFIVGIMSGVIPAVKASKLDPVEALRYE